MTAATVGLGNIWRFPYMAGENGGAFIIAYLACLLVVVLPIMMLEVGAGRLAAGNTVHTFRQVNRVGTVYGWFVVLLTTVITSYYLVITGWTLGYAVAARRFDIPDFSNFTAGNTQNPRLAQPVRGTDSSTPRLFCTIRAVRYTCRPNRQGCRNDRPG